MRKYEIEIHRSINQPQWSHPTGVCPTDHFMRGAYIPYKPTTTHRARSTYAYPHPVPSPVPYYGGGAASWHQPSGTIRSSAYATPSPWSQQHEQQLATKQRERAEAQQQLRQCQQAGIAERSVCARCTMMKSDGLGGVSFRGLVSYWSLSRQWHCTVERGMPELRACVRG